MPLLTPGGRGFCFIFCETRSRTLSTPTLTRTRMHHSLSLSPSLSLSHTHTHTRTHPPSLSLSYTHTHTHTHHKLYILWPQCHAPRLAMGIASQLTPCCQMNQSTPLIHPPPADWGSIPNHDSEDPIAWRSGGGCCLKPLHSQTTVVVFTTFAGSSSKCALTRTLALTIA